MSRPGQKRPPTVRWVATRFEHGPVRIRRRLLVDGLDTPFFVDTNRYAGGDRNELFGAGMSPRGGALRLNGGTVAVLKAEAERRATSLTPPAARPASPRPPHAAPDLFSHHPFDTDERSEP